MKKRLFNTFLSNIVSDSQKLKLGEFPLALIDLDGKRKWFTTEGGFWTEGFWIGLLFDTYLETNDTRLLDLAYKNYLLIKNRSSDNTTHDLGFLFYTSAWKMKEIFPDLLADIDKAVSTLIKRVNTTTKLMPAYVYNGKEIYIIDTIMNLFLPFEYFDSNGDQKMLNVIIELAKRILSNHIMGTGKVIQAFTTEGPNLVPIKIQGATSHSCWSRGFAWAIFGSAWFYNKTRSIYFRNTYKKLLKYLVDQFHKRNSIPYDFEAEGDVVPLDSSAAAIILNGLREGIIIDNISKDAEKLVFNWLINNCLDDELRLVHGCYHFPKKLFIDNELIFGDYYFFQYLKK